MSRAPVSIVSVAHNRRQCVGEMLAALRRQTHPASEVILIDNGCSDCTSEMVRSEYPEVRLIETHSNLGMVAYNLGFEAAQGDYILVMDDDGLPGSDDWIAQVVDRFETNPRLGAVSCSVRMRDSGRAAGDSPQFIPEGNGADGYPGVAYNGTGAGLRAAALRQIGYYPWQYFRTYLELHLCTRLLDAGWQVRHFPDIEVWHCRSETAVKDRPGTYYGLRNYYWYVWQFYPLPYVVGETLHHLAHQAKVVAKRQVPASRSYQATRDAITGARLALIERHSVSTATMQYMRRVRRHGNHHDLPALRRNYQPASPSPCTAPGGETEIGPAGAGQVLLERRDAPDRTPTGAAEAEVEPTPLVSVVSLACNRRANVAELLSALRSQTYSPFEVILVDNASADDTADMVRRQYPEVKLIETGSNLGMVAYNLGFEAAQGKYILVMDDDGLPRSNDWIAQVVQHFEANPRLGVACCTVRMRDTGRIAYDSPQFAPEADGTEGYPGVAFNGTGAGLRAAALRQVGHYPPHFNITYLELHLCTRLLDAGWQVRHFPGIEVWHNRPSGSSMPPLSYHGLRNYYWYAWELYPWPQAVGETLHRFGWNALLTAKKKIPAMRCWQATIDALSGAGRSFRQREAISPRTLKYVRWVRRQGNWHNLTPQMVGDGCERPSPAEMVRVVEENRPC
jgi:GT2 family glycosyltransferase